MKKHLLCVAAVLVGLSLSAQENLQKTDSLSSVVPDSLSMAVQPADSIQVVAATASDTLVADTAPASADTVDAAPAPLAPVDSASVGPAVTAAGDAAAAVEESASADAAVAAEESAAASEAASKQSKKQISSKEKKNSKTKKEEADVQTQEQQYASADNDLEAIRRATELAAEEAERKAAHAAALKKAERDGRRSIKGRQYKYFNHMGIGVNLGILNGIGADIAFPLGGCFQIRGGYSFIPSSLSYKEPFDLGEHSVNGTPRSFDNVSLEIKPGISTARAFLDFFPGRRTSFHFTVGAYYGVGSNSFVDIVADIRGALTSDEYGTAYIELEDTRDPSKTARVSTDEKGFLNVSFRPKQEIRPYVGIGWGRGANLKRRVSVSFEIGALYVKGLGIEVYDYDKNAHYITSGMTDGKDTVENPLSGRHMHIIDDLGKFPVLPMMKFGINVRLF
ncbi:MAG: hypothetical protein IJ794_02290 [Lachnospiraceae bacterium]|nr:hypothetical protein [Lachnospiraceae bacterium]